MTAPYSQALLDWYFENRRDLPFRRNRDPYRIWVSEIMAQQTRIEAMIPYFERFMTLFPDIPSLADAPEDQLHKAWAIIPGSATCRRRPGSSGRPGCPGAGRNC